MRTRKAQFAFVVALAAVLVFGLAPLPSRAESSGAIVDGTAPAATVGDAATGCTWTRLSGNVSYQNGNGHILESAFAAGEDSQVETIILASEDSPAAAAAACGLAGAREAPIVMTPAGKLSAEAKYELQQYAPLNVVMVGFSNSKGRVAVRKAVSNALSDSAPLINANLYASSASAISYKAYDSYGPGNALENYFSDSKTAIVASAAHVSDIATVGAYAYVTKSPIFLSETGTTLSNDIVSALVKGGFETVVLAGSTDEVSRAVEKSVSSSGFGGTVLRWGAASGTDACANSAAIVTAEVATGTLGYDKLALAAASDIPDAIMGASACGENGAPLLVAGASAADWSASVVGVIEPNKDALSTGYVLGTRAKLSADFVERLQRIWSESSASDLNYATISVSPQSFAYTGAAVRPEVTVVAADGSAVPSSKYLMSYYDSATDRRVSAPTAAGTYTITASGIADDCTNSRSTTFSIKAPASLKSGKVSYKVLTGSTVAVKKVAASAKGTFKIPADIEGYTVTAVSARALSGCKKLTSVSFASKKLASIGANAFKGCKKVRKITFSSTKIAKVGSKAFAGVAKNCVVKVPASCAGKYGKLFRSKGLPNTAKVKKA